MSNFANEKTFDERLKRIGDLYEEIKDLMNGQLLMFEDDQKKRSQALNKLTEMRDIAAISLKANHEIKDN